MHGAKRTAFLEKMAQTLPADLRPDFREVVEPFIRRKEELFPFIQRPILGFDLTWWPDGPFVSVISGLTA